MPFSLALRPDLQWPLSVHNIWLGFVRAAERSYEKHTTLLVTAIQIDPPSDDDDDFATPFAMTDLPTNSPFRNPVGGPKFLLLQMRNGSEDANDVLPYGWEICQQVNEMIGKHMICLPCEGFTECYDSSFQLSITPPPHKPYIHQPIPSKGIGLIATRQLLKETEILIDTSLFSVTLTGDQQTDALSVGTKLKSLPKESQLKFFALNNVFLKESGPFIGVMRTNSFQHNENWHILPTISRMNHSCKPNCDGVWSSTITQQIGGVTTFKLLVRKDIRKGEELTITYVYPSLSREEKREELKREFGFDCACKECKPVVLSSEGRNINARMSNAWQSLTKINERLNEKGT